MFAETRGDCGTATAAMRGGPQRVVGRVSGGGIELDRWGGLSLASSGRDVTSTSGVLQQRDASMAGLRAPRDSTVVLVGRN